MSRGYIEILSPNFLPQPLEIVPWPVDTHARVTFIPFFRFKAVEPNTSPSLRRCWRNLAGRLASWSDSDRPSSRSRIELSLSLCVPLRSEKSKLSGDNFFFFLLEISLDLSSESWNGIGRDFWLIFTNLCPRSGMVVEIRSLQYRIYSVRILSGRRHKRRCLFNFSLILVCSCKRISNFNCGCL